MDTLMLSAETYAAALPDCKEGEVLQISVTKAGGETVSFQGTVAPVSEDGSYSIPITMAESESEEMPIKAGKIGAALESKKGKPSKAAAAAMGY